MNLEKKVEKLGLLPLDDNKRYELAFNKDYWTNYKKYDYYRKDKRDNVHCFSTDYLNSNSYRVLKKKWKESNGLTIKSRLDTYLFRFDFWKLKAINGLRRLFFDY